MFFIFPFKLKFWHWTFAGLLYEFIPEYECSSFYDDILFCCHSIHPDYKGSRMKSPQ